MLNFTNKLSKTLLSILLLFSILASVLPMFTVNAVDTYELPWLWPVPGSYQINSLDVKADGEPHYNAQSFDIGANGYTGVTRLDIVSATDGTVHYIQNSYDEKDNKGAGWGNYVVVKTADTYIVYAHLQSISCKYGKVKAGDTIGKMGMTGDTDEIQLHIQAYPVNEGPTSDTIKVFDEFKDNPLYAPQYKFRTGLSTNSSEYGVHIRSYYKNSVFGYDTYSGGLDLTYSPTRIGAEGKIIRVAGGRVYSSPTTDNPYVSTLTYGNVINVYGYYTDAYGNIWYQISKKSEDKWIRESDIAFKGYIFDTTYENISSPTGTYPSNFDPYFDGVITSANLIKSVKAQIKGTGGVLKECTVNVNKNEYYINNSFAEQLKNENMADGEYTYEILVTETAQFPNANSKEKTYSIYTSAFKIDKNHKPADMIKDVYVSDLSYDSISVSAKTTNYTDITRVIFNFQKADTTLNIDVEGSLNGNIFSANVASSSLRGGEHIMTVTAYDAYGNTETVRTTVVIPTKAGGEVWSAIGNSLRIRTEPKLGSKYDTGLKLSNNELIVVTETYNDGTYLWGRFNKGWSALGEFLDDGTFDYYCIYKSGYLYDITFNLNGGTSFDSTSISKQHGKDIVLPSNAPTKDGYVFLGWSDKPDANTVVYRPSDTYTKNSSAFLFAVWSDQTDSTIHSFKSYSDASISENDAYVRLPYSSVTIDLTVNVANGTSYSCYTDAQLSNNIPTNSVSISSDLITVYYKITAANGSTKIYTVKFEKAGAAAQMPTVNFTNETLNKYVGDELTFSLDAQVNDGGAVTTVWYAKYNSSQPYVIGQGSTCNLRIEKAGEYQVYAVVTNTNTKCSVTTATITTENTVITSIKSDYQISVSISDQIMYNKNPISPSYSQYVGDGEITFKYYSDSDCKNEITAPINVGTYYIKAFASETDMCKAAVSAVKKIEIVKSDNPDVPLYSVVHPTLRDSSAHVTVLDDGVEYSFDGTNYKSINKNEKITVEASKTLYLRFILDSNYSESKVITVTPKKYEGTDGFYPNGSVDMKDDGTYLIVNASNLKPSDIISSLSKTENIVITDKNGSPLTNNVYTSCLIMIKDELGVFASRIIVIIGDVDNDGAVTYNDAKTILRYSNGMLSTPDAEYIKASDIDSDGVITSIDSYKCYEKTK